LPDDPNQPPAPSLLEQAENWTAQKADEGRPPEGPARDDYDVRVGFLKGVYGFTKSTVSGLIDIAVFAAKVFTGDPATQQKIGDAAIWFAKNAWIAYFGTQEQKQAQGQAAADWISGVFHAAKDKLTKDWEKAKKDGKENELIAEWATRGILEVASLFIGIGEVKAAVGASDLSKVGNVLDKAKVVCKFEEAAMAEKAAEAEKAAALAKAAAREDAIAEAVPSLDEKFGAPKEPVRIKPFEVNPDGSVIRNPTLQEVKPGSLLKLDPTKEYIWLVDEDGKMHVGEELVVGHEPDGFAQKLGHPTLAGGKPARIGGELRYTEKEGWTMNNKSGRFSKHPDRTKLQLDHAANWMRSSGVDVKTDFVNLK
jgi:hypothetical protein